MASEEYLARKLAYIKKYQKRTYKNFSFKVRFDRKDIIEKLGSVPSMNRYIVSLIEKDIAADK